MVGYRDTKQETMPFPREIQTAVDYLNEETVSCSNYHEDGRVNSVQDEDTVITMLEKKFGSDNIQRPASREWWDVKIYNYPVQIKSTNVAKKSADNFSSKAAILYALTYLPESQVNVRGWAQFEQALLDYSDIENDRDYYILVVDKGSGKAHLTSLKSLVKLTPNGNNLPFQVVWADNLSPKNNTFAEAKSILVTAYKKSVTAKINAHPLFAQL